MPVDPLSEPSHLMATLDSVVWNCGGLTTSSSTFKAMFFEKNFGTNFDIAVLLETHHRDKAALPQEFLRYEKNYTLIHSPAPDNEPYSGIVCLVSNTYNICETTHLIPGRLFNVKLENKTDKTKFNLTAVYLHTNNNLNKTRAENFVQLLRERNKQKERNIILGDFNFIDHHQDKANGLNPTDKMMCSFWIPFLAELDMVDPFREQYPKKKNWSFIGTGKAKNSRIDRVYVNSEDISNVTQLKYQPTPFGGHRILKFTIKGPIEHGKSYYKMNTSILKESKHKELIENLVKEINEHESNDPIHKWQLFTALAKSRSITYSKIRAKVRNSVKMRLQKELIRMENDPGALENEYSLEYYNYIKRRLKKLELEEIEGYTKRLKLLAPYDKAEPKIAFYADMERKKASKDVIGQLGEVRDGPVYTARTKIMEITTDFYKKLYTPDKVNSATQEKLLKLINKKFSKEQKAILDARLKDEEVEDAVYQLNKDRSPGLDGLPAEFYQEYWYLIKPLYLAFIRAIKSSLIPKAKNTSVIKLIYKNKGEIVLLENYRPISLINVDIKILCKTLANRLIPILPSIIHTSQTAVYGRRIDHTVHLIRDLIDLANKEDDTAAFIFLDQEKAFDRVNHNFLFKVMKSFGIGDSFINWIKLLYSNASAVINVNGFLTNPIPLNRGVRQGCPLSSPLYVMVIEVLALQLRSNPNIVGFQIEQEKFVSAHYMDDSTIIIKQNRCFKEVIKELSDYEEASGAKVNYQKTKGLWTGSWKGRRTTPLGIEWTSKNVRNLGVYFGNDDPSAKTFSDITPKVSKRLHYWKTFKLSPIGKARTTEIFIASTLVYAIKFYKIPDETAKKAQNEIRDFVNFPQKTNTIEQKEMWRLRHNGGIKLPNLMVKSKISKVKWLIELVSSPEMKAHLCLFKRLIGVQKGDISGRDLLFLPRSYILRHLKTESAFYMEALTAISELNITKGVPNVAQWDKEHLFYNSLFSLKTNPDQTISINRYFEDRNLFTFGQFLDEKTKQARDQQYDRRAVALCDQVALKVPVNKDDLLVLNNGEEIKFNFVTHKQLYEDTISRLPGYHHSQIKWRDALQDLIVWDDVWYTVHNYLNTYKTTSLIWQQIHLNFYTQYSYNKWHKVENPCPLCGQIPKDIFHLILHCTTVVKIWQDIEPLLLKLHPVQVSNAEKAFGIVIKKPQNQKGNRPIKHFGIHARNWLTYLMRKSIAKIERKAHYSNFNIITRIKKQVQYSFVKELDKKTFHPSQRRQNGCVRPVFCA